MAEIMKRATLDFLIQSFFFIAGERRGLPSRSCERRKLGSETVSPKKCGGEDPGRRWKSPSFLLLLFPVLSLSNVVETTRWHKRGGGGEEEEEEEEELWSPPHLLY